MPEDVLMRCGAVSRECVEAMARGVCELMRVPVGLAISGIAGPGGGTPAKPWARSGSAGGASTRVWSRTFLFKGQRREIKMQSVQAAILELIRP